MGETVPLLGRPVYSHAEADRLLRESSGAAQRWIDGYTRAGVAYPPVIHEHATNSIWVTWGEFVEARLLAEFRRGISRLALRPVLTWLRGHTGEAFPLACSQTFLEQDGRDVLLRAQVEANLDTPELWLVTPLAGRGALLTAATRRFVEGLRDSADDDCGTITALHADKATPAVVLSPHIRQGQPSVGNIPTERLAELVRAGDSPEAVADGYGLGRELVEQAVTYEATRHDAA